MTLFPSTVLEAGRQDYPVSGAPKFRAPLIFITKNRWDMYQYAFSFLLIVISILAPAPPQIAFNPVTKECGVYWGGDEYADYAFPSPWETSYGLRIKTESGVYEWDGRMDSVQDMCEQMGFTYIEGNLGSIKGEMRWGPLPWLYLIIIVVPIVVVIVLVCVAFNLFLKFLEKRHNSVKP